MADDRLEVAIEIVARHVLASFANFAEDTWEDYPEIGENDFERVMEKVKALAPFPEPEQYQAAYAFLEARADPDA